MTRKSIKGIERRLWRHVPKSYSTFDTILHLEMQATWARMLLEGPALKREVRRLKAIAGLAMRRRLLLCRKAGVPPRLRRGLYLWRIIGGFGRLRARAVKEVQA